MSDVQNNKAGATSKAEQHAVKLRPTLYIGLGGTGMEVMMRVRRRILNANWGPNNIRLDNLTEFPLAQFIHLDLDQSAIIESNHSQKKDLQYPLVKFTDDERLVESLDIDKYSRDEQSLSRYPHIRSWFPLTPQKIRILRIDPNKGAGQIRSISRLYFFDKYPNIKNKIDSKLKVLKSNLSKDEILKKLNLELDTTKFRIIVIGSGAGGTGSGSFLDIGWLSKWIAKKAVDSADVELMMFLPTGYAAFNKERTEANGYSALMELETAMVGYSNYIERWDKEERLELSLKPYDEVHLIDSGNLASQHTDKMSDVYSMVADTLFEDFRSADFANRKRSVAVNQRQHKMSMYNPPLSMDRFGDMKLSFSCAYSSFGQSILDTLGRARYDEYAYRLASDMLKAFFGVADASATTHRASQKQCDHFMSEYMSLGQIAFNALPTFSAASLKQPEVRDLNSEFIDLAIVDHLLISNQSGVDNDIANETRQRVSKYINEVSSVDRDQWAVQVRRALDDLSAHVIRDANTKSDTAEDQVIRRRKAIFETMKRDIESQLYLYLDNQEQGGFEYVISLVEQIKGRIENANTGIRNHLKKTATRYSAIKDIVRSFEYEKQLKDLEETKGNGFLGLAANSNEAQARSILDHLSTDISNYLVFHLRARAATEASELMQDISNWLGISLGVDEQGQTIWNGLMGELIEGQDAVLAMMKTLDHDCKVIHQEINTKHATLQIIATDEVKEKNTVDPRLLCEWAADAFHDFGGSRELFRALLDPEQQSLLLLKIVRMAEKRIVVLEQEGITEDPLYSALDKMSVNERRKIFDEWLKRAMPWIDASTSGDFPLSADRFKCFIGVNGSERFERKFKAELVSCIPTGLGLNANALNIVETGEVGRAVCYVELSGFPLTILRGIEGWCSSYQKQSNDKGKDYIPVHTHIDLTRFKHPYAPTPNQLSELADDFKCYLKAVLVGVLIRSDLPNLVPSGQYGFEVARGDSIRIGNEKGFRLNGLPLEYRDNIYEQVQKKFNNLSDANLVMLIALADFYATQVYTPILKENDLGVQVASIGFACAMAKELKKDLIALATRRNIEMDLVNKAIELTEYPEEMTKWAIVVENSDQDAYEDEVREASKGRRLKWILNMSPSVLQMHEQLLQNTPVELQQVQASSFVAAAMTPPPAPGAMPPPLIQQPQYLYHVAINGQSSGPYTHFQMLEMLQKQQINPITSVWREGLANWITLSQCPELLVMPPPIPTIIPPVM